MESHRFPSRRDCPICSVLLGGGRTRLELHLPVGRISVRAETHHLTVFGGGGGDDVRSKWAGAGNGATIRTTRAMQVGPWIFVAIDTLVRSAKCDRVAWARGGTTTLTVAGMLWLTGGYPGIWLTAPVLAAPYALPASRGRFRALASVVTTATIAALLALGMCALLIDGAFNLPRDSALGVRPGLSSADGALALPSLIHTFLANLGYLRNTSGGHEPLYLGAAFLPGLLMIRSILPTPIRQLLPVPIRTLFLACTTLGFAFIGIATSVTNSWSSSCSGVPASHPFRPNISHLPVRIPRKSYLLFLARLLP
jgi:hypothetical protein